jgi:hypothetical protein
MSSGLININCYKYPWENTSIPERIQVPLRECKYPWENTSIPERIQVSLREYKYPWENTSIPERIQVFLREYKYPWENIFNMALDYQKIWYVTVILLQSTWINLAYICSIITFPPNNNNTFSVGFFYFYLLRHISYIISLQLKYTI